MCVLPKDRGPCRNFSVKWHYDKEYGGCTRFWYGGCDGNLNRFNSQGDCSAICIKPKGRGESLKEPESTFREPVSKFRQPVSKFREQESKFREPVSKFREPVSNFREQASKFREPVSKFREPVSKFR